MNPSRTPHPRIDFSEMAPVGTATREHAAALDRDDALSFTRDEFIIPTKAEAQADALPERGP